MAKLKSTPIGLPKRIVVLGGTSTLAQSYAMQRAVEGADITLVARDVSSLEANARLLEEAGASRVSLHVADLADCDAVAEHFSLIVQTTSAEAAGPNQDASATEQASASDAQPLDSIEPTGPVESTHGVDEVVLAYAQAIFPSDEGREIPAAFAINLVSAALWLEHFAGHMQARGSGRIVVVGSVVGDKGRASNYLYGSTKAGLATFTEGLGQRLIRHGVTVTLVKPGWIATRMSAERDTSSLLYARPETVARAMCRAVDRGRAKIYVPWFWRPISLVVRMLPRGLLNRLGI